MMKEMAHWSDQKELRSDGSLHCHREFLSGWCRKLRSRKVTFVSLGCSHHWAIFGSGTFAVNGPHPFLMLESMQMHAHPFLNCASVRFQGSWPNPERGKHEGKDYVPMS